MRQDIIWEEIGTLIHPHWLVEIGTILVESNLVSRLEVIKVLIAIDLPLGVYLKLIIKKEEKLFMKISWEGCFQRVKNWNSINQKLVNLKGWMVIFFFIFVSHVVSVSHVQLFLEQSYEYMGVAGFQ